jgi:hypothetical protein
MVPGAVGLRLWLLEGWRLVERSLLRILYTV